MKTVYPDNYSDDDKGMYDDMILKGQALIGNKISKNDAFLIDLASRMTINQINGRLTSLSKEEIEASRTLHRLAMNTPLHETPIDIFDEKEHPLSKPAQEFYEENMTKPIDDIMTKFLKDTECTKEDKEIYEAEDLALHNYYNGDTEQFVSNRPIDVPCGSTRTDIQCS